MTSESRTMGDREILELLLKLEWAGRQQVFGEDDDITDWVEACPACGGLEDIPNTITVGDKYQGYHEFPGHPDHIEDVGHKPRCPLQTALTELQK